MASHSITIAKAAFAAACLRPDAIQLTREDVSKFHNALETAVSSCTPANIQTCKKWLVDNIVPSALRATALGKYLVSYSKNIKPESTESSRSGRELLTVRKRLHILYILNDVFHHVKHHNASNVLDVHITDGLRTHVADLFQMTHSDSRVRVNRRLEDLLNVWEKEQYFSKQVFSHVRKALSGAGYDSNNSTTAKAPVVLKEAPYTLPSTHGDPTVPYYDLPAANLMPHIVSNKSIPILPNQVQALQLSAGPADEGLVNALKDFLKDVEQMENPYHGLEDDAVVAKIDDIGQVTSRNEADEVVGETYYGWSREFCQKMKKRGQEDDKNDKQDMSLEYGRSRSITRSRSHSYSKSPPKRRRYDQSRSRSPPRHSRYRSRSISESPDRKPIAFQQSQPSWYGQGTTETAQISHGQTLPYPRIALDSNGLPIPPPRPPNYHGPWPPPPPPLLVTHSTLPFPPPPPFLGPDTTPSFNPYDKYS